MPTKKGKSKPSKARKASSKKRKSPRRGVTGRAGATRRVSTGRVTATGSGSGTSTKAPENMSGPNPGTTMTRSPEGIPDRKATDGTHNINEGSERIRDL
jgi:hypothetical protein